MFNLFSKKNIEHFINTDIHSHLLPGVDDGVQNWDQSIEILQGLRHIGISKVITTPHIIFDYYPNTPKVINEKVETLKEKVDNYGIDIQIDAAAEYMLDEHFLNALRREDKLLTFGSSYVLVETGFINRPFFFKDVFFQMKSLGYQPVLAHPERYIYFQEDFASVHAITEMGVMLQINLASLVGYYSSSAKKLAEYLIDNHLLHFIGSDIHNLKHLSIYKKAMSTKYFEKCRQLFLYNNSL